MMELPAFGLRAYALFFLRHGASEAFTQRELDWIVSEPMRKKIFYLLLRAGWIRKAGSREYKCVSPEKVVSGLLQFKVPQILEKAPFPYALTQLSAVEAWSDYSYVQRGFEKSPYFLKVLEKDLRKWRNFLNSHGIPNYVGAGSTIGEFVVLLPVKRIEFVEKDGLKTEPLKKTLKQARKNALYAPACEYMKRKYGVN